MTQKLQDLPKKFQQNEEKLLKELNETRAVHNHQLTEMKGLIEQLKHEKEQLRREEVVQVQPKAAAPDLTANKEEREQLEKEIEQLKQTIDAHQQQYDQQGMEYAQLKQQTANDNEQFKQKLEETKVTQTSMYDRETSIGRFRFNNNLRRMNYDKRSSDWNK